MAKKKRKSHTGGTPRKRTFEPAVLIGNALAEETDRGCVLVGYSYIEFHLEWLLRAHFNQSCPIHPREDAERFLEVSESALDPDNPNALLGTGSSRLLIAFLTGLIDLNIYNLALAIKSLRIRCAHGFDAVAIDEDSIAKIIALLDTDQMEAIEYGLRESAKGFPSFGPREEAGEFSQARLKFMHACTSVDGRIQRRMIETATNEDKPNGVALASFVGFVPAAIRALSSYASGTPDA